MKEKTPIQVDRGQSSVSWHYCTGQVESLVLGSSAQPFTWIRGIFGMPCGMCYLDKRRTVDSGVEHVYEYMTDLRLTVSRTLTDEGYVERYQWQNTGEKEIRIEAGEVGVYMTFAEKYDIREVALPYRTFTHVLSAGDTFYVYNARMNGEKGGVGLVLREGVISEVKEERLHPEERGDLVAFIPPCTLAPQETIVWEWLVFAYDDVPSFWQTVRKTAHKIMVSPRFPDGGQTVTVLVDDQIPSTVIVNGETVSNPFSAPLGKFTLRPLVDNPQTEMTMVGQSHVSHWAEQYHGWGRSVRNPRDYIRESVSYAERFAESHIQQDYDKAVASLACYYRVWGAYRRPQAFLPALLIKSSDLLREKFTKHLATACKPNRRRYTAQVALAEYEMFRVANIVFEGKYRQEEQASRQRALPLLDTPFGILFSDEQTVQKE